MGLLRHFLLNLLLNILALVVVDQLLPQMTIEGGWQAYMVVGVLVGLANAILKPILKLVTFPLMMLTAGLFIFVINALMLYVVSIIVPKLALAGVSFAVVGWLDFLLAAVLFSVVNAAEHWLVHDRR